MLGCPVKAVTVKFNHWLPKLLGAGAITLDHTIYFKYEKSSVDWMKTLFRHECEHVLQVENDGFLSFLWIYFFQWIRGGFKYREIGWEKEAYARQGESLDADMQREWNKWFL